MSLSQALSTAVTGLHAAQIGMSVVASNVANAQTPGYIRKTPVQTTLESGGVAAGVRVEAINRELDVYLQRQLRTETSGGAYADTRALYYQRLQQVYGAPGSPASLEAVYHQFDQALMALAASPDSPTARSTVISTAQVLAQQLNGMTLDIQALRADTEHALAGSVQSANDAMAQIASINRQLATMSGKDPATAALLDQRDAYINQLSWLMDITVVSGESNQISVFTNSGVQLVGAQASILDFNARGSMAPGAQWSPNAGESGVGTLKLKLPNGGEYDLLANGAIRSGEIAALVEMRDRVLVQAQNQLDAIAAGLASALSDRTTAGTAVTVGPQSGFEVDIGALQPGNTISLTYFDNLAMQERHVTIVRVDDPSVLPLSGGAHGSNSQVIGVDFSGGMASVVNQLNAALNGRPAFSNPGGDTLRVLDDGAGNLVNVTGLSATHTVMGFADGGPELPFFLDSHSPYTGAITASGHQALGFAGRIQVNPGLASDPSRLVVYSTSPPTAAGDPTRPDFIHQRLNGAKIAFSPNTGLGSAGAPFEGSVATFMQQMLSMQGQSAANAQNLADGQKVVVNALQERFAQTSGVNVDLEMAALIQLQTAYSANARVMTTVREMIDMLLRM